MSSTHSTSARRQAVTLLQLYPKHSRMENIWSQLCLSALAGAVCLWVQARRNPPSRSCSRISVLLWTPSLNIAACASVLPQHAHACSRDEQVAVVQRQHASGRGRERRWGCSPAALTPEQADARWAPGAGPRQLKGLQTPQTCHLMDVSLIGQQRPVGV